MTSAPNYDDVAEGDELPELRSRLRRVDLVRYCGASGDFNVIHWNERAARSVGLPDVIAHGMLTMASAARVVTDWLPDPGAIVEYAVRFSRPVVVPDDDEGTQLVITARVGKKLPDRQVRIDIVARVADLESSADTDTEPDADVVYPKVLSMARAVVALP